MVLAQPDLSEKDDRSKKEWFRAIAAVAVGALLAGVTTTVVSERQLSHDSSEQKLQRQATATLQRDEAIERAADERRSARQEAYADYIRRLDRLLSAIQAVSADVAVLQGNSGKLASILAAVHETHQTMLDGAYGDYSLASATVQLLGDEGVSGCRSKIDLALSSRILLITKARATIRVAAAGASETSLIVVDERVRDDSGVWLQLSTALQGAFVTVAQGELNTGKSSGFNSCTAITVDTNVLGGR